MEENIERMKIEIERQRLEGELRFKEAELALKREELLLRQEEIKPKRTIYFSPLVLTALTALIGLIGTCIGLLLQGSMNIGIERQRMESSLILKAIETGNSDEAAKNLRFLLNAGLIRDEHGRIAGLVRDSNQVAVLPLRAARMAQRVALEADMTVFDVQDNLRARGFYIGELTGMYDEQTIEAIKNFQRANDLMPDGILGFKTMSKLRVQDTLPGTLEQDKSSGEVEERPADSLVKH